MESLRPERNPRRPRGTVAIEYALILPLILLFIIGIIDVGRLLWTYTTLYRAAEASARCGAINAVKCGSVAAIQGVAVDEAWGLKITSAAFTVSLPSCGVQVVGTYDFAFAIPAFFAGALGTITLKATACYSRTVVTPSG